MSDFSSVLGVSVQGVLFDLDGVFYEGDVPIPGGPAVLDVLQSQGIRYAFITNTTTRSREALVEKLKTLGLFVNRDQIVTAPIATTLYLASQGYQRCMLVVNNSVMEDFAGIETVTEDPDCLVIGDIGNQWDYALLNRLFHHVMAGADIVAMHKNRFWKTEAGLQLDIGGFVAALEYATGVQARVVGKPSPDFYQSAIESLGLPADQVMVVGDDVENDVGAGQAVGLKGVLVKTGKYRDDILAKSGIKPDAIIDSITDLPRLIKEQ